MSAATTQSASAGASHPGGPSHTGSVQSVDRAFALLEAIADASHPLPLGEIAQRTRLAPPTVHRLLKTLQSGGYVLQTPDANYTLGAALIRLGDRATPKLAQLAGPVLAELEHLSEETANLAVLEDDLVTYIAQVPSRHHMRMFTEVGRRVLPHASGVGKAMLSTLPEDVVKQITSRTGLPKYTPTTLTTPTKLLADLAESRRRGFAIDDGEQEVGVRCIAVALPGVQPPAAVSISGPAARVTEHKSAAMVRALHNAAARLAQQANNYA